MSESLETRDELPVIDAQIVRYQPAESLTVVREPEEVLADAQKAAAALMKVVNSKKKQIAFNGETYLESGDWQTVAKFYGVTAKIESTKYVTYGEASGFEAAAVALDCNGRVVSRGEAMCLNDEENWGRRTKYAWKDVVDSNGKKIWEYNAAKGKDLPKREKVEDGYTQTPLFQLRSMAQTRACGKALSNLFKWVVVLAGYKPTPAEEMIGRIDGEQNSSVPSGYEPDLPSESGAISHQPTGAAQAPPVAQPPTSQPAAAPAVSQGQDGGVFTLLPPENNTLICTVRSVKNKETKPTSDKVNPKPYLVVTVNGFLHPECDPDNPNINGIFCYDTKLFDAVKGAVSKPCLFKLDLTGKFVKLIDVLEVDGYEFKDGQIVMEGAAQ
jgi:hypothetical protein